MSAGQFSEGLVLAGWFDPQLQIAGWFDESLLANTAGGTTATVTPTAALVTIAGQTPSRTLEAILAPTTGAASMLGRAITLSTQTTLEATVSPSLATLTVNGLSVTQQTLAVLLPSTGTIAFSGYSPAALGQNQIGATTGAVSLIGHAPSLALEAVISPITGAVALLGLVPSISTGAVTEATITPDTAILGASGSVPWIELEPTGKSAKYRNRRTKYWYDEPKTPASPVVTPSLPENPPALNVVAIPQSEIGAEIERVNREIADASQKLEAYRRRRAKRREEEAIIALLAA